MREEGGGAAEAEGGWGSSLLSWPGLLKASPRPEKQRQVTLLYSISGRHELGFQREGDSTVV